MLGAAWCESAAGDPAHAVALLDEVASLVAEPDDAVVAQMAATELGPLIRLGRFAECDAVADRGAAAARRAARPDIAYTIWIQAACALSAAGDLTGALRAANAGVAAARGMTVIEVLSLSRPRVRAVPARPPRRGAGGGARAAGQGRTDGLARGRRGSVEAAVRPGAVPGLVGRRGDRAPRRAR